MGPQIVKVGRVNTEYLSVDKKKKNILVCIMSLTDNFLFKEAEIVITNLLNPIVHG